MIDHDSIKNRLDTISEEIEELKNKSNKHSIQLTELISRPTTISRFTLTWGQTIFLVAAIASATASYLKIQYDLMSIHNRLAQLNDTVIRSDIYSKQQLDDRFKVLIDNQATLELKINKILNRRKGL